MSKSGRHATFPLDCDAQKAANDKVKEAMGGDPNERDSDRRIRIDGSDEHYRQMWMDAYIEAGGGYKHTPQKRKLGQPVMNCPVFPLPVEPKPETANLYVYVKDAYAFKTPEKVHGATVIIRGPEGSPINRKTDPGGTAQFSGIKPGNYHILVRHDDFFEQTIGTVVEQKPNNKVVVELKPDRRISRPTQYVYMTARNMVEATANAVIDGKDEVTVLKFVVNEKYDLFEKSQAKAVYEKGSEPPLQGLSKGNIFGTWFITAHRVKIEWLEPSKAKGRRKANHLSDTSVISMTRYYLSWNHFSQDTGVDAREVYNAMKKYQK